jgi:hypothetical protein
LYELYRAFPNANGSWDADSGAVYTLTVNGPLRPAGWTSADAAGLPMLPGLVRYDETASGEINHAIRFTVPQTRRAYVWPARHFASNLTGLQYPPMGQRFRLKASFQIDGRFSPEVQVILRALKKYGMILADNGSSWYLSGAPDDRWNNDHLHQLDQYVSGSDFEAVDVSSLMINPNSGQVLSDLQPVARSARDRSRRLDGNINLDGGAGGWLDPLTITASAAVAERSDRAEWIDRERAGIDQAHRHRHASARLARDLVFNPAHGDRPWRDARCKRGFAGRRRACLFAAGAEELTRCA